MELARNLGGRRVGRLDDNKASFSLFESEYFHCRMLGCRVPKAAGLQGDHAAHAQESRRGEQTQGRGRG